MTVDSLAAGAAFGAGFVVAWWLRGRLTDLLLRLAIRVLASSIGKKAIRETLAQGFDKLDAPQ